MEEETFRAFVYDRDGDFATNVVPAVLYLTCKRGNVDVLQKAETKRVVHFEKRSDD